MAADGGTTTAPRVRAAARRNAWLVVAAALIGACLAAGVSAAGLLGAPRLYESTAVLTVDQPVSVIVSGGPQILFKLSTLRLKYTAVVPTAVIVQPVAHLVGVPPAEVVDAITVANPGRASNRMEIRVRSGDAYQTPRIAEAVANELVKHFTSAQDRAGVPRRLGIRLERGQVTPARRAEPSIDRLRMTSAYGGLLGLAVGMMTFLRASSERRYHGRPDADLPPDTTVAPMGARRSRLTRVVLGVAAALVGGALFAAAGVVSILNDTPVYSARTILLIDQPGVVSTAGSEGVLVKLVLLRLKYAAILKTEAVTAPAAQELGIPVGVIAGATDAQVPPNSLLITVTAQSGDRALVPRMADVTAKKLIDYLKVEQDRNAVPANLRITLSQIAPPRVVTKIVPDKGEARTRGILGGFVGIAAGFVLFRGVGAGWRALRRAP